MGRVVSNIVSKLNPVRIIKDPIGFLTAPISIIADPSGSRERRAKNAGRDANEFQARAQQEASAFQARQNASRDRAASEESDAQRAARRGTRGRKRSLLTGDERGVTQQGVRKTTG